MTNKNVIHQNNTDWTVNIDTFEGPLDLLLYLINKNNVDIYDIPIANITSEYLKYLEHIKDHNLDNVGDFLVMASILMRIKSRTLLPSDEPVGEGEEDVEKMKQDLIRRLIEYKQYKEYSQLLKEKELHNEGIVGLHQYPLHEFGNIVDSTLFDLIDSFESLIKRARKDVKDIITEEFTVEDKIRYILDRVEKISKVNVMDLLDDGASITELIVTLLAVLELVRTHQIIITQKKRFGEIYIENCGE